MSAKVSHSVSKTTHQSHALKTMIGQVCGGESRHGFELLSKAPFSLVTNLFLSLFVCRTKYITKNAVEDLYDSLRLMNPGQYSTKQEIIHLRRVLTNWKHYTVYSTVY